MPTAGKPLGTGIVCESVLPGHVKGLALEERAIREGWGGLNSEEREELKQLAFAMARHGRTHAAQCQGMRILTILDAQADRRARDAQDIDLRERRHGVDRWRALWDTLPEELQAQLRQATLSRRHSAATTDSTPSQNPGKRLETRAISPDSSNLHNESQDSPVQGEQAQILPSVCTLVPPAAPPPALPATEGGGDGAQAYPCTGQNQDGHASVTERTVDMRKREMKGLQLPMQKITKQPEIKELASGEGFASWSGREEE